jgi:hypothetical protein
MFTQYSITHYSVYCFRPQLGQTLSVLVSTNPHCTQLVGCASPRGAPHAIQAGSPSGLAVPQYSQVNRLIRSVSWCEAPAEAAVRAITCQTFSLSCKLSISWARSSSLPSTLNGLRNRENAVCPRLAATPSQACCPSSTMIPSVTFWIVTVRAVCPPDMAPGRVPIWTARLSLFPKTCARIFPWLNSASNACAMSVGDSIP